MERFYGKMGLRVSVEIFFFKCGGANSEFPRGNARPGAAAPPDGEGALFVTAFHCYFAHYLPGPYRNVSFPPLIQLLEGRVWVFLGTGHFHCHMRFLGDFRS